MLMDTKLLNQIFVELTSFSMDPALENNLDPGTPINLKMINRIKKELPLPNHLRGTPVDVHSLGYCVLDQHKMNELLLVTSNLGTTTASSELQYL